MLESFRDYLERAAQLGTHWQDPDLPAPGERLPAFQTLDLEANLQLIALSSDIKVKGSLTHGTA